MLAALAGRLALAAVQQRPASAWPSVALGGALALALGGCLWWVAHRQVGFAGAVLALALYTGSPSLPAMVLGRAATLAAALGLFAMLYTGVGVAHALQGPRRKWPQRILLMAALCAFTAVAGVPACGAGLLLALGAMLYLAEGRRALLPLLLLLWAGAGAVAFAVLRLLHLTLPAASPALSPRVLSDAGAVAAFVIAIVGWLGVARSRYFGNTAPLLAACALAAAGWATGAPAGALWGAPFALLFVAGVFADGFESGARRLWIGLALGVCVLQWVRTLQT